MKHERDVLKQQQFDVCVYAPMPMNVSNTFHSPIIGPLNETKQNKTSFEVFCSINRFILAASSVVTCGIVSQTSSETKQIIKSDKSLLLRMLVPFSIFSDMRLR